MEKDQEKSKKPEIEAKEQKKDPMDSGQGPDKRDAELAEMKGILQKLQAEFENYSKRVEKEKKDFRRFACADLARELLPVLDSFDNAVEKTEKEKEVGEKALMGMKHLRQQLVSVLEKNGVKRMDCIGKQFNPETQECILHNHVVGKEDGIVLEEIQSGYLIFDKVLRPAKVKVNTAK